MRHGLIRDERPDLLPLLANKDDGNIYTTMTGKEVNWICPGCGRVIKKKICKVTVRGLSCPTCGDGVSRPEKIVAAALSSAGIEFVTRKSFSWSDRKVYDFFIPEYNSIIEVNGSQHYGYGFKDMSGVSLEYQNKIDSYKFQLAERNGISNYFVIVAIDTSAVAIVPQVKRILRDLGVTAEIEISKCEEAASTSNVVAAADMWNAGKWTGEISRFLGCSAGTTIEYLKRASAIGLCNYTALEAHRMSQAAALEKLKRRVRCVTTGEEFDSIAAAAEKYAISSRSNIIRSCNNEGRHAGVVNGEPLSWEYV